MKVARVRVEIGFELDVQIQGDSFSETEKHAEECAMSIVGNRLRNATNTQSELKDYRLIECKPISISVTLKEEA